MDANWFYFEKLCTSLQWRKLSTHQHLNLSSNPYYWMHSLLSNTLQRNPPAGHVLLPFLIFFSAICLGHKLIRSVSLRRVFTHDRPPLRSAYHQKPTHIQICHSRLEWLSNPLSLAVRCVCVSFCGGGGAYLLPLSDEAQTKGGVHEAPACTGCKHRVREKGKTPDWLPA